MNEAEEAGPRNELEALQARNEALEQRLHETQQKSNARHLHAGLKAEALRAGMVDLDGLRLIDQSCVSIDQDGEVQGARDAMVKARRDRPWLFSSPNSSSVVTAPQSSETRTKLATEMTLDEWRAARSELLRRR